MLRETYAAEIDQILARYPADQKRSAVMPMLYLAQRHYGNYVPTAAMDEIAAILEIEPTQVASIVGFYTLYYDEPAGRYRIQICTDLPCALRGADQFAQHVCQHLGVKMGETTADGAFTVEEVMCLAACDRAPMFQVQAPDGLTYHENMTVESTAKVLDQLRAQTPQEQ